jgi:hypothetical protein
MGFNR